LTERKRAQREKELETELAGDTDQSVSKHPAE
jgi:hypothetical protein